MFLKIRKNTTIAFLIFTLITFIVVITTGKLFDSNLYKKSLASNPALLHAKVFLDGVYISPAAGMSASLGGRGLIPKRHPYNLAPYNYKGNNLISTTIDSNVVDWVLIELRDSSRGTLFEQQAGLLLSNGSIVDSVAQVGDIKLASVTSNSTNYQIVIKHRNHLSVSTSTAINLSPGMTTNVDFTNNSNVLNNNQKLVSNGQYAMVAGNVNSGSEIDASDRVAVRSENEATNVYSNLDVNMDGYIDSSDRTIARNTSDSVDQIPVIPYFASSSSSSTAISSSSSSKNPIISSNSSTSPVISSNNSSNSPVTISSSSSNFSSAYSSSQPTTTTGPSSLGISQSNYIATIKRQFEGENGKDPANPNSGGRYPAGVPWSYSWKAWTVGVKTVEVPSNRQAGTTYDQVYQDSDRITAPNARVKLEHTQSWYFSKSQQRWIQIEDQSTGGAAFAEDFVNNQATGADSRGEGNGDISVRSGTNASDQAGSFTGRIVNGNEQVGYLFHGFGNRYNVDWGDVQAILATQVMSCIPNTGSDMSDCNKNPYIVNVGIDSWLSTNSPFDGFQTHGGVSGGRLEPIKSQRQIYTNYVGDVSLLDSNPPPMQ